MCENSKGPHHDSEFTFKIRIMQSPCLSYHISRSYFASCQHIWVLLYLSNISNISRHCNLGLTNPYDRSLNLPFLRWKWQHHRWCKNTFLNVMSYLCRFFIECLCIHILFPLWISSIESWYVVVFFECIHLFMFNSSWPNHAIWQQRSGQHWFRP